MYLLLKKLILDIIVQIFEDKTSRMIFVPIFVPNMHLAIAELVNSKVQSGDMSNFSEQDQRVSFLTTLLDIHILALRKCNQDGQAIVNQLLDPFDTILEVVNTSNNPIPVIKASICIKSYLLYTFEEVDKKQILLPKVYRMLDRLLDIKEQETISFYLGNILMILFEKVTMSKSGA